MALPPEFLETLRTRTPLPELIGRRTRLLRNGRQWKGCCPFHQEKTPSFYVYDDHFHCFGCGAHGDAITFLMRAEGAAFPEAVERLAAEAGLEVPKPDPRQAARAARARDLHGVLEAAAAAYQRRLASAEGKAARDYLIKRGVSADSIARFGIGWSGEGRGALAAELRADGIETAPLVEAGLMKWRDPDDPGAGANDLFYGRVMFPIRDARGRAIGFGGRILGDGQPKYLNGPETAVFRKRECLYGLDLAREGVFRGGTAIVVEGYLDVIALHQAGFLGAVAPLGTALTSDQLLALWRISPDPVLCFDGDAAGGRAAARTILETALPLLDPERRLRLATMPAGDDPDTLVARGGASAFQSVLDAAAPYETRLLPLLAERTGDATPQQRAALMDAIEATCRTIPHRALAAELRALLRDGFFARHRARRLDTKARRTAPPPRPLIDATRVREARAAALLAILLRHPALLVELEDALLDLDWPPGPAASLAAGLQGAVGVALDSAVLVDHLAQIGLRDAVEWTTEMPGIPAAARSETDPVGARLAARQFIALLQGDAALVRDRADAARWLGENTDSAAARRLIGLAEALALHRAGGPDAEGAADT